MAIDMISLAIALKATKQTAEQTKAALEEYLQDHPDALDQAAVESIVGADLAAQNVKLDNVTHAIEDLEAGSLSAVGATAGQVPVADGNGSWVWGNVSGGGVNLVSVQTYVADYTNEPPTPASGSVDKYYRRIYGT